MLYNLRVLLWALDAVLHHLPLQNLRDGQVRRVDALFVSHRSLHPIGPAALFGHLRDFRVCLARSGWLFARHFAANPDPALCGLVAIHQVHLIQIHLESTLGRHCALLHLGGVRLLILLPRPLRLQLHRLQQQQQRGQRVVVYPGGARLVFDAIIIYPVSGNQAQAAIRRVSQRAHQRLDLFAAMCVLLRADANHHLSGRPRDAFLGRLDAVPPSRLSLSVQRHRGRQHVLSAWQRTQHRAILPMADCLDCGALIDQLCYAQSLAVNLSILYLARFARLDYHVSIWLPIAAHCERTERLL
mmetsp:Transcript_10304/g.16615  ORF Transcript_10304/g.16615 Transcript_10304/m.16615 type:complete len:300 (+) Transcript_10304:160-1059(+)